MKAFIIICALSYLINSQLTEKLFLQLPFDVDWRESSLECLDNHKTSVDYKYSFVTALEDLLSIKSCLKSKGQKILDFNLEKYLECEKLEKTKEYDEYLNYLQKYGISEKNCYQNFGEENKCVNTCTHNDKLEIKDLKKLNKDGMIMQEILFNGPVLATFDLYSDFFNYKEGIYIQKSGEYLGKHTVLLIGYVRDGEINHWIAKNSFGADWGEKGYFKIPFEHLGICESVKSFNILYKYQ